MSQYRSVDPPVRSRVMPRERISSSQPILSNRAPQAAVRRRSAHSGCEREPSEMGAPTGSGRKGVPPVARGSSSPPHYFDIALHLRLVVDCLVAMFVCVPLGFASFLNRRWGPLAARPLPPLLTLALVHARTRHHPHKSVCVRLLGGGGGAQITIPPCEEMEWGEKCNTWLGTTFASIIPAEEFPRFPLRKPILCLRGARRLATGFCELR